MRREPVVVLTVVALVAVATVHAWPGVHLSRFAHGAVTVVVLVAAGLLIRARVTPWHPGNPNVRHPQAGS